MEFEVDKESVRRVSSNLESLAEALAHDIGSALYAEAQTEREESMRRTPVDTGALRASHTVSAPKYTRNEVSVTIGVGGPSAPYAVYVHENLDATHKVGRAKFLESTIMEAMQFMAVRIAARLRLRGKRL